jgi:hypothetical protein
MLTGAYKKQRMASALTFLEGCHKDGEFLSHIVPVTRDETWVLFVNVTPEGSQSSGCTHIQ